MRRFTWTSLILALSFLTFGCFNSVRLRPISMTEQELPYRKKQDFFDHTVLLAQDFKKNHQKKMIFLSSSSREYIRNLSGKIKSGNDFLFSGFNNEKIFIIHDNKSFHFSFPNGHIFLSTGLLRKYIQHEGLLASVLIIEMIRSHKRIFSKKILIPTGVLSFNDLAPLTKIDLTMRNRINKWTIFTLRKSGFNPLSLLQLLQIKNKNFYDFFETLEEGTIASLEEVEVKNFLLKNKFFKDITNFSKNSSSEFYFFMKEIKQS